MIYPGLMINLSDYSDAMNDVHHKAGKRCGNRHARVLLSGIHLTDNNLCRSIAGCPLTAFGHDG